MKKTALLVIDVQNALVESNPYNKERFLEHLSNVIEKARKAGIPVIYVQHDGGIGDEVEKGSFGWELHQKIAPLNNQLVFNKRYNSAFVKTTLHDYLQAENISQLIITGMQTEYCIDATIKSAFERDYQVKIVAECVTTFDNRYLSGEMSCKYYLESIWNGRFGTVISAETISDYLI